jgi:uncharacterized YigZ family protein
MKSILRTVTNEIIIQKSRFINFLIPVKSIEDVIEQLTFLRSEYPDANHHCYAYIIGENQEIQKYEDDGEPSKTAGMPMIEVLKKQDLTNVLTVSIRYFGGIKLGAGGLVRAYTKSVSEAIKIATFSYLVQYVTMSIIIPFDQIGHVEKYLRDNFLLLDTVYTSTVQYKVELLQQDVDKTIIALQNRTNGDVEIQILDTYERYE